ncbi:COG1835 Predicted acyltransferases [Comamonadaceae bacterium]
MFVEKVTSPVDYHYRPDIDGLRAIAVIFVVLFHAFPSAISGGFVGVDIFFVISGFLISRNISSSLAAGEFSFLNFYARRIRRIFPALILVVGSSALFGWFALFAEEYSQLGWHIFSGSAFSSNFSLWHEAGYFDNSSDTKPLLHLWSLAVEEQFYIIWPLILWCAWKRKSSVVFVVLIVLSLSLALNILQTPVDSTAAFYSPLTRFWELLGGAFVAQLKTFETWFFIRRADGGFEKCAAEIVSALGLLLLLLAFFKLNKDSSFPGIYAVIPVLGAMMLIYAGGGTWLGKSVLSLRPLVYIGLISFPLYLWHWPILSFARIVEGDVPSVSYRVVAIFVSLALAWATYRYVEIPARASSDKRVLALWLMVSILVLGGLGLIIHLYDGFPHRKALMGFVDNKGELTRTPESDNLCRAYVGLELPLFPYCRFTSVDSSETVAVIGDSHAHVAYPGIAEYLSRHGRNTLLLGNSSCPPFVGVFTGQSRAERESCIARIEQLLGVIEKNPEIKKVFIFTRGPVYTTGVEPLSGSKKLFKEEEIFSESQFFVAAQLTFNRLRERGKQVFYVSENPELNFMPDACLVRPFKLDIRDCTVDSALVYERQAGYLDGFRKLQNVTFIDGLTAFCPDGKCRVFDDQGFLLYADDDHLSIAGSRFLANTVLKSYLH